MDDTPSGKLPDQLRFDAVSMPNTAQPLCPSLSLLDGCDSNVLLLWLLSLHWSLAHQLVNRTKVFEMKLQVLLCQGQKLSAVSIKHVFCLFKDCVCVGAAESKLSSDIGMFGIPEIHYNKPYGPLTLLCSMESQSSNQCNTRRSIRT